MVIFALRFDVDRQCLRHIFLYDYDRLRLKCYDRCRWALRDNHYSKDCKAGGCKKCNGRHNTLLHFGETDKQSEIDDRSTLNATKSEGNDNSSAREATVATHTFQITQGLYILLATARVCIFGINGKSYQCRALLDNGSQSNFITKELTEKLDITKTSIRLPVGGVDQSITNVSHKTKASIKSLYNNYNAKLTFMIVDNITQELPNKFYNISAFNIPDGLSLADPRFNYPEPIDLLLGAGVFWELLCAGQIQLGEHKPFLQKTKLGWIVSGPIMLERKKSENLCHLNTVQEIYDNLERFWELEECLPTPRFTREESECENLFVKTVERDEQGRFTVQLPLRSNVDKLGDSLEMATRRLYALEKRLAKDPNLKKQYVKFLNEYQELGHMTEVQPSIEDSHSFYYLPHHSVTKESSSTTKTRVVFYASAKTSSDLSLNDVLMIGPII